MKQILASLMIFCHTSYKLSTTKGKRINILIILVAKIQLKAVFQFMKLGQHL